MKRKSSLPWRTTYFGEEAHTADARNVEIGNNAVESLSLQIRQRFCTTADRAALGSRRAQDVGKKLASDRFIVDGENAWSRMMI